MTETVAPPTEQIDPELVKKQELKNSILKICEPMCISLNKEKPTNITSFMISWLKDKYNISSSLLKSEEKKELEMLKNDIGIFHEMDEHFYFIESQLKAKKEAKVVEKKSKVPPKPKPRLPPDDIIPSDEEDNNPDEIDTRLDNKEYIESNSRSERRIGTIELLGQNKQEIKIKFNNKSPEVFEFIKINLMKSPLFSDLSLDILTKCINAMEEKSYSAMSEIVKQGDYNDFFYFIFEGELECKMGFTKIIREGNKKREEKFDPRLVKVYYPGDYFCELNLLYHTPIRGTIKTITEAKLYLLERKVYKKLLNNSFKERNDNRILLFKNVKVFETLEDAEFERLTQIAKQTIYYKGDTIIKEDEFSNMLMIIEEGNCVGKKIIEKGKMPVKKKDYKEGYIFFEQALLKPEISQENIIAESDVVKLICIDRYSFKNIFGSLEPILMRNMELYKTYFPPLPEIVEENKNVQPIGFEGENINPDNNEPINENNINNVEPQNANNIELNNLIDINNLNNNNIDEMIQKLNKEKEDMIAQYEKRLKELNDANTLLKSQKINNFNDNNNNININNNLNNINNNMNESNNINNNNNINDNNNINENNNINDNNNENNIIVDNNNDIDKNNTESKNFMNNSNNPNTNINEYNDNNINNNENNNIENNSQNQKIENNSQNNNNIENNGQNNKEILNKTDKIETENENINKSIPNNENFNQNEINENNSQNKIKEKESQNNNINDSQNKIKESTQNNIISNNGQNIQIENNSQNKMNNNDSQNNNIDNNNFTNTNQDNNNFNSSQNNNLNNGIIDFNQDNNNEVSSKIEENDNIKMDNLNKENENLNNDNINNGNNNDNLNNNMNNSQKKEQLPEFLKEDINPSQFGQEYKDDENNSNNDNKNINIKNESPKNSFNKSVNPFESNVQNSSLNKEIGEKKSLINSNSGGGFMEDDNI